MSEYSKEEAKKALANARICLAHLRGVGWTDLERNSKADIVEQALDLITNSVPREDVVTRCPACGEEATPVTMFEVMREVVILREALERAVQECTTVCSKWAESDIRRDPMRLHEPETEQEWIARVSHMRLRAYCPTAFALSENITPISGGEGA